MKALSLYLFFIWHISVASINFLEVNAQQVLINKSRYPEVDQEKEAQDLENELEQTIGQFKQRQSSLISLDHQDQANFQKLLLIQGVDGPQSSLYFLYNQHRTSPGSQAAQTGLEFTRESCQFSLVLEQGTNNGKLGSKREILSTLSATKARHGYNGQFLRTGLGNINFIPIIEDGDIQGYPTAAYFSKDQKCRITQNNTEGIVIESEMQTPLRVGNITGNFKAIKFVTNITFGNYDEHGLALSIENH